MPPRLTVGRVPTATTQCTAGSVSPWLPTGATRAGLGWVSILQARPMSCVQEYFEVIDFHTIGFLTIHNVIASIK